MTPPEQDRGRSGGDRATPKALPNWRHRIARRTRAAIERAAVWGFVHVTLARRLVRRIGGDA
jgi:hypothetical protein